MLISFLAYPSPIHSSGVGAGFTSLAETMPLSLQREYEPVPWKYQVLEQGVCIPTAISNYFMIGKLGTSEPKPYGWS